MFEKIIIALILVLAAVLVFSGCTTAEKIEDAVESKADAVEDMIESKFDPIEDAVESRADAIEDAAEQVLSNALTPNTPAREEPQDITVPDEMLVTQADPVQDSLDKIIGIVGNAVKEHESELHIPDSVVDNAVSSPNGQIVFITPEEAKRIALDHANVAAEDAIFDRTERDYDNGIYHYEVEFRVGLVEYEYDIHAQTGKILSFDQDR